MSRPQAPSPRIGAGWSASERNDRDATAYPSTSPTRQSFGHPGGEPSGTGTWASAKTRTERSKGYAFFSARNQSFFGRHYRRFSDSLPQFRLGGRGRERDFSDKEKLGRGRWFRPQGGGIVAQLATYAAKILRRLRLRLVVLLLFLVGAFIFGLTPLHRLYRSTTYLGGGGKFVIMLAANQGGGVMEWKGPREWAIERDSVKNKKNYAKRWGYHLEVVDMTTRKRYAHEWRESWEKVDTIRNSMRKYPRAEWFWWLDLHTFIMEPSYSLQAHIFDHLSSNTYRDINEYNPLNITHPFPAEYVDELSRSPEGDGQAESINLIVPQDCGGFNLGSFLVRRSTWTDQLLDIWWDPAAYEQKHMEWEHKEQDALEYLYRHQAWIRPHTAFIPQRTINSFPPGACSSDQGLDGRIHYNEQDRDFLVNMAGCEWGRDCWGEMYSYRELSNRLNRNRWEKFKDGVGDAVKRWKERSKKKQKEENRGNDERKEEGERN